MFIFCSIYLEVSFHTSLVLLALGFVLVDTVNLVAQLGHAVVVLLAESSQGALVGNVSLIEIGLQFDQLCLYNDNQIHIILYFIHV